MSLSTASRGRWRAERSYFQCVRHVTIALHGRLRGGKSQVLPEGVKVRAPNGNHRYLDVLGECGAPRPGDLVADKPTVLFEVLSPSTE